MPEFNYWLHKGYAQLKSFPGGTSKELLCYVEPTLKNKKFDSALLHVGVNDLLNDESQDSSISNMCRDNSFVFIDNNNVPTSSLFRDGLHLLEVGKRILANNFIDNLNNFLRIRQTQRPPP